MAEWTYDHMILDGCEEDKLQLFEILVPCNWNDGRPIRTRHHKEWDKRVRRISNGLTILKPGKGQWVHEGELYHDRVIPVRIMCTESQIRDIAYISVAHYEQEAVMYYPVADCVVILGATDEQRNKFIRPKARIAERIANAHSERY